MASSDADLEEKLLEAGNKLEDPPSSVEELLSLLDQVEGFLSRVEQSPADSMQNALSPSMRALVADKLLRHSDVDVKVSVASCISEITRISAPDAPYDDDQMKEVFRLIVSSFENLYDKSSRSYAKRTSILETVAKVRSCVVMLDLECDALILEMFQHFLKEIREHHPENIFSAMETIMTLVIEESEDISSNLLSPLLASIKKDNKEVLPIAQQLGVRVLESCAMKLKPYLVQAVKTTGVSMEDYSSVLASICQDASSVEQNNVCAPSEHVEDDNKSLKQSLEESKQVVKEDAREAEPSQQDNRVGDGSPKSSMSNGTVQVGENDTVVDPKSPQKKENVDCFDQSKCMNISGHEVPNDLDTETVASDEPKQEQATKKQGRKSSSPSKSTEPSVSQVVANEKEAEKKLDSDQSKNMSISGHEVPNDLDTKTVDNNEQKQEQGTKLQERKSSSSTKSTESSVGQAVDNEKEVEKKFESHNKEVSSSPYENHSIEVAGSLENEKEINPKISSSEEGGLDTKIVDKIERKKEQATKRRGKKSCTSTKSTEPSMGQTIDSKKEVEKKLDSKSQSKEVPSSPCENHSIETAGPSEHDKEINPKISSPEAGNNESEVVASPSPSENLRDENRSKKLGQAKPKDGSEKKMAVEDASKKVTDGTGDSEAKPAKQSVKKPLVRNSDAKKTHVPDSVRKGSGAMSDRDAKKQSAKKVDESNKVGDGSSSRLPGEKKKLGRGKASETGLAKDVDKEMVSSPRSSTKLIEDENSEETPKTNVKRKHTSGKENESAIKEYGKNLVGLRVKVYWPIDHEFYKGVIDSFDSAKKKHKVMYDDGEEEILNLRKENWEIIKADSDSNQEEGSDHASHDGSTDMPPKKKGKTSAGESIKQGKMDASSKSGGAAASSRSKGASTKSSHKSKDGSKSKDSKTIGKSEDDVGRKSNTPKSGSSKSAPAAQKMTSKSKDSNTSKTSKSKDDDRQETPKSGKSKQETPKTAASKVKSPKSGGKSNVNGTGKVKSGLLKRKVSDSEDLDDSEGEREDAKGKASSSSKAQRSEGKSGKKQRRS